LAGGARLLLAACYDAIGLAHAGRDEGCVRNVHRIRSVSKGWTRCRPVRSWRKEAVRAWRRSVAHARANIVAVAIHRFARPSRTGYWQRHGIQAASAALRGALVLGASHFEEQLPEPERATLAVSMIAPSYLAQGTGRRVRALQPVDALEIRHARLTALVRIFVTATLARRPR
jgi:hypothetical protein